MKNTDASVSRKSWRSSFNPIPTSTGWNQPIYEYHVTAAGRNRVENQYFTQFINTNVLFVFQFSSFSQLLKKYWYCKILEISVSVFEIKVRSTARPWDTWFLVPEKNCAAQNHTLWGLYLYTNTVEDGQKKKLGEHKVTTPEQQFLGIILCFLCI